MNSKTTKVATTDLRTMYSRRLKKAGRLSVLCVTFIVSLSLSFANASIVNGTFDGITFSPGPPTIPGWTKLGLTPIMRSDSDNTFAPLGPDVAFLVTPEDFSAPTSPPSVSDIEMHLDLAPGSISGLGNSPINGAVIAQTFTANAGDVLSFEYNHLSFDDIHVFDPLTTINDFSFVSLFGPGISILQILGDRSTLTGAPDNLEGIPAESELAVYKSPPLLGGTYTLGIGVFNSEISFGSSALLVDNVTLTAVPEATARLTWGVLTACAAVLTVPRARRQRHAENLRSA